MARLIIDGFKTVQEAKKFWDWFEGQGEQDDTIPIWMGEDKIKYVNADIHTKTIVEDEDVKVRVGITYVEEK